MTYAAIREVLVGAACGDGVAMHRLSGARRWSLLLLAGTALLAIAMVPRGVVRTTEAAQERGVASVSTDSLRYESAGGAHTELPGVRAVVSREERDAVSFATPPAVIGSVAVARPGGLGSPVADSTPGASPAPATLATASRAPPSSV